MILTKDNYHSIEANQEYFSNSQVGDFLKCEAMAMAKLSGEYVMEKSEALIVGSYVDAWNNGELDKFKEDNPEIFSSQGPTKGQLKSTYRYADEAIEVIKNDEFLSNALKGDKQRIFTAELFGVKFRCAIDSYFPRTEKTQGRIVDLKYLKGFYDKFWVTNEGQGYYENVFQHRGYFRQVALYCEIERIANGRPDGDWYEPFLAVVTKDSPSDKDVVGFISKDEALENFILPQLVIIENNMERIIKVKNGEVKPTRCNSCEYCRATKKLSGTKFYRSFDLY